MLQTYTEPVQAINSELYTSLTKPNKFISSKFFYDEYGSQLFEEICELDEYYVTKVEMNIMKNQLEKLSELAKKRLLVIELGSGSNAKIRCLLDSFNITTYLPIDISAEYLGDQAKQLIKDYPNIDIHSLAADYTQNFMLPQLKHNFDEILIYYPGSSIGNFEPADAKIILERIVHLIKLSYPDTAIKLLVGVDLIKDTKILHNAYNDSKGITAKFNLNILKHLNNIAGTNFDLNKWTHYAFYNSSRKRIEMHLISSEEQRVKISNKEIFICRRENIRTEYSYKYTVDDFSHSVAAKFKLKQCLTDINHYFGLLLYKC